MIGTIAECLSNPVAPMALLVLLVAGHVLGDFAYPRRMTAVRFSTVALHTFMVLLIHLFVLFPLMSWPVAALAGTVALLHGATDLLENRRLSRGRPILSVFVLDQVLHMLVLLAAWLAFGCLVGPVTPRVAELTLGAWMTALAVMAAFAFNAFGGSVFVSGVLATQDPKLEQEEEEKKAAGPRGSGVPGGGMLIGILERTLSLVLILTGEWASIAILVAAKSIARFDELKERRFSEYYLIGTFTSLLVAVLTGMILRRVLELI